MFTGSGLNKARLMGPEGNPVLAQGIKVILGVTLNESVGERYRVTGFWKDGQQP